MHLISDLGDLLEQGKVSGMYTCGLGSTFCVSVASFLFLFMLSLFFFLFFFAFCEGYGNRPLFIEHLVCEMKMFFLFFFLFFDCLSIEGCYLSVWIGDRTGE